ncbi:hypothetical protein Lalb_Chr25g0288271 [Lupinus albus]|uniref:Uncharacterized protein n=1 Tax=Lupinus albus TaxID=3870 RepID=A0A6A4MWN3_LUPAL|nr:hypothetical protein Lalb_Chr25g0288271 [Lupinus albus]
MNILYYLPDNLSSETFSYVLFFFISHVLKINLQISPQTFTTEIVCKILILQILRAMKPVFYTYTSSTFLHHHLLLYFLF